MSENAEIDTATVAAVEPETLERDALSAVSAAATVDELERVRVEYLGRKSELKLALREVRERETGMTLNALRERLEGAFAAREGELQRGEIDRRLATERVDVTEPGLHRARRGHLHLITQIRREFEDLFLGLGYAVVDGREVETTHYNFDALSIPLGHPTRSPTQTLFLDEETVLRTETSPAQIRTMEQQPPPLYVICPGRVYRRDTPDATHTPTFHQVEGLAVDEGITLGDLEGTLDYLMKALFGESRRSRFVTNHFPFTEPSLEALVSCHICDGSGCPVCRHSGWIEVGGSGMVDPKLFELVGYDPERYTGFAFGWGLERIAVLRHGIPDLRELWRNDPRLLEQF
jgi:phenylalanyl-tRNA synthetase alpha chain